VLMCRAGGERFFEIANQPRVDKIGKMRKCDSLIDFWEFYDYVLGGSFMRLASHTVRRSLYSESGRCIPKVVYGNWEVWSTLTVLMCRAGSERFFEIEKLENERGEDETNEGMRE